MGLESQFGKRTSPPEDPHTKVVKGKLNKYRNLTQEVAEKSAVVSTNEERRTLLEQELPVLERVYDDVRTGNEDPDFSSLPQDVLEELGEINSHTRAEIEAILKAAITARSSEAQALFQSAREINELSEKHEALGRRPINEDFGEEE
jgi:hypothetical protein